MSINHEPRLLFAVAAGLPKWMQFAAKFSGAVEFSPAFAARPQAKHALFDFDGALSLIREGWPEVIVPMFAEMLPAKPSETEAAGELQ